MRIDRLPKAEVLAEERDDVAYEGCTRSDVTFIDGYSYGAQEDESNCATGCKARHDGENDPLIVFVPKEERCE